MYDVCLYVVDNSVPNMFSILKYVCIVLTALYVCMYVCVHIHTHAYIYAIYTCLVAIKHRKCH